MVCLILFGTNCILIFDSRAACVYMDINLEPAEKHRIFAERMEFWNRMIFQDLLEKYAISEEEDNLLAEIDTAIADVDGDDVDDDDHHGHHGHGKHGKRKNKHRNKQRKNWKRNMKQKMLRKRKRLARKLKSIKCAY